MDLAAVGRPSRTCVPLNLTYSSSASSSNLLIFRLYSTDYVCYVSNMTPKEFFENTLPGLFKGLAATQPELQQIAADFEIVLPENIAWCLSLAGGELKTREGNAENPLVSFVLSRRDWDRVLQGEGFLPFGGPAGGGANPFKMSTSRLDKIKTLKGELVFHVIDGEAAHDTVVKFNPKQGAGPRTELEISVADLKDLSEGKANPQQLFMQGKMRIKGDMAFAMQIGSLAMTS